MRGLQKPDGLSESLWEELLRRSLHDNHIRAALMRVSSGVSFENAMADVVIVLSAGLDDMKRYAARLEDRQPIPPITFADAGKGKR